MPQKQSKFQLSPSSSSQSTPQFSKTLTNPPKKRKVQACSPHFNPIQREFDWSFCGSPVINAGTVPCPPSFEEMKNKIIEALRQNISYMLRSTKDPQLENSFGTINFEQMITKLVSEIFDKYALQSQT